MQPITIFRGTSGLNTVADPARIPMTKSGINDVAEIVNMRIDQYGRPSRRPGFSLLQDGSFHSLFSDGRECFVVKTRAADDAVMQVSADSSLTGIWSGLTHGARMSWVKNASRTYCANGFERGYIHDGVIYPWEVGEYHGPATNRSFVVPDNIKHLDIHSGRMFASSGPVLWWSEPFRFDLFNLMEGFAQFDSDIRMVRSVGSGLFVSSMTKTYFLTGLLPSEFSMKEVASFPAVEWSDARDSVDGGDIGFNPGLCLLWASPEGAILGTPDGMVINLTKKNIIYPENVNSGFGALVGYEFIHGME